MGFLFHCVGGMYRHAHRFLLDERLFASVVVCYYVEGSIWYLVRLCVVVEVG